MDLIDRLIGKVEELLDVSILSSATSQETEKIQAAQVLKEETDNQQENVTIIEPDSFAKVQDIVDQLKNGSSVVVRLNQVSGVEARKIIEFISGAIYALGGYSEKIGENVFLFTPSEVEIVYQNEQ
ncbi:hypothetical protein JCM16358_24740 [Halanaerocella petrolearia]